MNVFVNAFLHAFRGLRPGPSGLAHTVMRMRSGAYGECECIQVISHPSDPPTSAKVIRLSLPTSVGHKIPATVDEHKSTTDENPLTLEAPVSDGGHTDGPRNRHCAGSDGYIESGSGEGEVPPARPLRPPLQGNHGGGCMERSSIGLSEGNAGANEEAPVRGAEDGHSEPIQPGRGGMMPEIEEKRESSRLSSVDPNLFRSFLNQGAGILNNAEKALSGEGASFAPPVASLAMPCSQGPGAGGFQTSHGDGKPGGGCIDDSATAPVTKAGGGLGSTARKAAAKKKKSSKKVVDLEEGKKVGARADGTCGIASQSALVSPPSHLSSVEPAILERKEQPKGVEEDWAVISKLVGSGVDHVGLDQVQGKAGLAEADVIDLLSPPCGQGTKAQAWNAPAELQANPAEPSVDNPRPLPPAPSSQSLPLPADRRMDTRALQRLPSCVTWAEGVDAVRHVRGQRGGLQRVPPVSLPTSTASKMTLLGKSNDVPPQEASKPHMSADSRPWKRGNAIEAAASGTASAPPRHGVGECLGCQELDGWREAALAAERRCNEATAQVASLETAQSTVTGPLQLQIDKLKKQAEDADERCRTAQDLAARAEERAVRALTDQATAEEAMRELRSCLTMSELALEEASKERSELEERVDFLARAEGGGADSQHFHDLLAKYQELKRERGRDKEEHAQVVQSMESERLRLSAAADAEVAARVLVAEEAAAQAKAALQAELERNAPMKERLRLMEAFFESPTAAGRDGVGSAVSDEVKEIVESLMRQEWAKLDEARAQDSRERARTQEDQQRQLEQKMQELSKKEAAVDALLSMASSMRGVNGQEEMIPTGQHPLGDEDAEGMRPVGTTTKTMRSYDILIDDEPETPCGAARGMRRSFMYAEEEEEEEEKEKSRRMRDRR